MPSALLTQLRWLERRGTQKDPDAPPFGDLLKLQDAELIEIVEFESQNESQKILLTLTGLGYYELRRLEAVEELDPQ